LALSLGKDIGWNSVFWSADRIIIEPIVPEGFLLLRFVMMAFLPNLIYADFNLRCP
jgi:hypothetical protein